MRSPDEIAGLRSKMIEHLEAALALADESGDGVAHSSVVSIHPGKTTGLIGLDGRAD
jgi:hypothetical protein